MYSHNGHTSNWRPLNLLTDDNYIVSRDGGLVIVRVNSAQHSGTFYCTHGTDALEHTDRVLVEHHVTMSGQSFTNSTTTILIFRFE